MLCNYCGNNEAINKFIVKFPQGETEFHLCEKCTLMSEKWYEHMRRMNGNTLSPWNTSHSDRRTGDKYYSPFSGKEIQRRLHINGLHARLKEAVEAERYEEAAKLRDEIIETERHGENENLNSENVTISREDVNKA